MFQKSAANEGSDNNSDRQNDLNALSVDDFSTSEKEDLALLDSRVRRNLDKPCRTVPMPTVEHSAIKGPSLTPSEEHQQAPSDLMKNNRRYSNVVEDADHDDVASVLPTPRENDHDHFNKLMMDASPSQSCNASQNLMKSLMKSYNAGNVQFYENLHQKYFAKAKAGIDDKPCDPPSALLDMTDDGAVDRSAISKADEISRFMADSRLNEGSRSRSRSRGANTSNNLGLASKISSVNMAAFS